MNIYQYQYENLGYILSCTCRQRYFFHIKRLKTKNFDFVLSKENSNEHSAIDFHYKYIILRPFVVQLQMFSKRIVNKSNCGSDSIRGWRMTIFGTPSIFHKSLCATQPHSHTHFEL